MNKLIKRQTVKKYRDKPISNANWQYIKEAIYWAPSSHGFEPYRVIEIENKELKKELTPLMWDQGVIATAPKMIFYISLKNEVLSDRKWVYERALRKAHKVSSLKGEQAKKVAEKATKAIMGQLKTQEGGDDWAMKQTYIALMAGMDAATLKGIGSTPMEGFERYKIDDLFRSKGIISKHETTSVATLFGYPFDKTSYAHRGKDNRVRDSWEEKFKVIK